MGRNERFYTDSMKDIPRTDTHRTEAHLAYYWEGDSKNFGVVTADFARELEKELNAALIRSKDYFDALELAAKERDKALEDLHYCNGTADLAIKHRDEAETEIKRLKQMIPNYIEESDFQYSELLFVFFFLFMTDTEINFAILESLGWQKYHNDGVTQYWHPPSEECDETSVVRFEETPCYTEDLNEMHKAEKTLVKDQWKKYLTYLFKVVCQGTHPSELYYDESFSLVTAPAQQRAEAFLRTLGKYKD